MSKKAKIKDKSKKTSKEQLQQLIDSVRKNVSAHGILIMFVIASLSIGLALYKSRTYLSPERNETKYEELSSKNNYSKIDYKLVEKLSGVLNDTEVSVSQSKDPDRNNPFSE